MEFHHVNQVQEKLVYLPKDFHKGFHRLLHPDKDNQKPLSKSERKRYESNRKKYLKFIGDAILCVLMYRGELIGQQVKETYFTDKLIDRYVFEYSQYEIFDNKVHQFVYYHFDNN
jgi:A nuclease of the HNH/ENDO VII superfamily with conserved LHH